jgi:hypothetical protein
MSISEIESAERLLMEGLNYEMICYHPDTIMEDLASGLANFVTKGGVSDLPSSSHCPQRTYSPLTTAGDYSLEYSEELLERGLETVQRALVFSDIPFLFAPVHFAFASMAVGVGSVGHEDAPLGEVMRDYIESRVPFESTKERVEFIQQVTAAIKGMKSCPLMNISTLSSGKQASRQLVTKQAEELHRVLGKVANIRFSKRELQSNRRPSSLKRSRGVKPNSTPQRKLFRVTPHTHANITRSSSHQL